MVGPSRFFAFGGYLIHESEIAHSNALIAGLASQFNRTSRLHATKLTHVQKLHFANELSRFPGAFFGIVSDKKTLGLWKELADDQAQSYYNRCAAYLLNALGRFLRTNEIDGCDIQITFEHRNHDYGRLSRYVRKIAASPTGDSVESIDAIDHTRISSQRKEEQPAFAAPDLIAHSIFSALDKNRNNFGIVEPRYLDALLSARVRNANRRSGTLQLIQPQKIRDISPEAKTVLKKYGLIK